LIFNTFEKNIDGMGQKIFFPIIGRIQKGVMDEFDEISRNIGPGDEMVSFISSLGGEANVMSHLVMAIERLPIKTVAYAGKTVYSSAAIIFVSYGERIAFEDSQFFIHECIPPKGHPRTEIFDQFDQQVWNFMIDRMQKISLDELMEIVKKGKVILAERALQIGMVDRIIEGPASYERWKEMVC
jgi:ATP-dependent protease ClpP protease subunit